MVTRSNKYNLFNHYDFMKFCFAELPICGIASLMWLLM